MQSEFVSYHGRAPVAAPVLVEPPRHRDETRLRSGRAIWMGIWLDDVGQ